LTIKYHHVDVTIKDQVAVTHVDQVFVNESQWQIEGTYVFPLPVDASVDDFAMWVDGEKLAGELLDRDQARRIYQDIVRRHRDPALLEYVDRGAFRVSIFPIPPGEERRVELEYSQVLPAEGGLLRYVYPLDTERFSARPLASVSVSVSIASPDPIKAVYSPSHEVVVTREGDYYARVGYEESNVLPDQDFELAYTVSPQDVGLNLISYRGVSADADGFFLMLVAPPVEIDQEDVVEKDVWFVLDTSGSMEGEKLEQAKEALIYVLRHLNAGDRFNITDFSTGVRQYAGRPQPAEQREEAVAWIQSLQAGGGTDINRALLETLAGVDAERPTILIFLTDGQPTEGEVEIDRILGNVADVTRPNVRLFAFGVGNDVNTTLLDTLVQAQRGASGYVRPGERIDEEISSFYSRVSTPLLADIAIKVEGVQVYDVYPYPLPDLFAGSQLIVVGRYRQGGPAVIDLTGQVNQREARYTYEGFFEQAGGDDFIPRLWATRKIGYLLNQIRLHGEQSEWVDEVVELSIRYGIVTPYTSYLVQEDADVLTREGRRDIVAEEMEALSFAPAPVAGAKAVEKAEAEAVIRDADRAQALAGEATRVVKIVGDKTFVYRDGEGEASASGVWIDTTFDPSHMTTEKVGFGSEIYFELLEVRPDLGQYFALGQRVIVVVADVAYEIVAVGQDAVTMPAPPQVTQTQEVILITAPPEPATSEEALPALCPGALLIGVALMAFISVGLYSRRG